MKSLIPPQQIAELTGKGVIKIVAIDGTCFALCQDGSIYGWGSNHANQLAFKGKKVCERATLLEPLAGTHTIILSGEEFIAFKKDGSADCWKRAVSLKKKDGFSEIAVIDAKSAGKKASFMLCQDGSVKAWGRDTKVVSGLNVQKRHEEVKWKEIEVGTIAKNIHELSQDKNASEPLIKQKEKLVKEIEEFKGLVQGGHIVKPTSNTDLENIVAIECGDAHCLALRSDGVLYTWGENRNGQVGIGKQASLDSPQPILTGVVAIFAGNDFSLAMQQDGTVYAWGVNESLAVKFKTPTKLEGELAELIKSAVEVNAKVELKGKQDSMASSTNAIIKPGF